MLVINILIKRTHDLADNGFIPTRLQNQSIKLTVKLSRGAAHARHLGTHSRWPPNCSRLHRGDSRVGSSDWLGSILLDLTHQMYMPIHYFNCS
jgi:hypothetical protein